MLDHYECQWCANEGYVNVGKDPERGVLEVDHILEVSERPDLAYDLDNTRTLCKYHHNQRHHRFQFRSNNKNNKITFRKSEWWGK
ncbi:HNH endonuclease [Enterococcus cecorum]|nr:HNH endonuclease [Enterococcus cecorum]